MKKVLGIILVALFAGFVQPAQAADEKVIAIIDNAMDSTKNKNIIYEVCITSNASCENKQSFQEGVGAANIANWKISNVDHGFNIAQAAVIANKDVKIVFIRISDLNVYPTFSAIHNDGKSLDKAIQWVSQNASKYGIDAVSISQSRSNFDAGTCPKAVEFQAAVAALGLQNIPTFVATGNNSLKNKVGFPACVDGVIGVGALKPTIAKKPYLASYYTAFASYTNIGPGLDVVARGDADVRSYRGNNVTITGTSVATPIAATIFVTTYASGPWSTFFDSLQKSVGYPYLSN